jgi:hypothetical protein
MISAAGKMMTLVKHSFSNLQTQIELGRVIEHKRYQMMNQMNFNKAAKNQEVVKKRL